jgi:hypothetical protein
VFYREVDKPTSGTKYDELEKKSKSVAAASELVHP